MNAAGVLFLLVGIPLLWAAYVVAKPYSGRRGG